MFDHSIPLATSTVRDSLIDCIGETPIIRLSRLAKRLSFNQPPLAKWEGANPGGSSKDRAALAMVRALVDKGLINEKSHLIEATSGNSGISLAWIAAIFQIPVTIVMPDSMSIERRKLIRHFGANLVLSPGKLGMPGAIALAKQMVESNAHYLCLDQFANPANKKAHIMTTAREIIEGCGGEIDIVIAGVGTGGTIAGLAEGLKAYSTSIEIYAVQPDANVKIPGIGVDAPLPLIDEHLIKDTLRVKLEDANTNARLLACSEGIAAGISAGAVVSAWQQIQQNRREARCLLLLPDTAERYYSSELFQDAELLCPPRG